MRDNPVPLALIGAGVASLMAGVVLYGRHRRHDDFDVDYTRSQMSARSAARPSRTSRMGETISKSARDVRSRVSAGTRQTGTKVVDVGHRASRQFSSLIREEPLIVGALAIALGALIGALIPSTDIEDEYLGPSKDDLVDQGEELAEEIIEDVTEVAEAAYEAGAEEAERQFGNRTDGPIV